MLCSLVCISCFSSPLFASTNTEHKAFLALEKKAKKQNKKSFYAALDKTQHPLAPYAEAAFLKRNPWLANKSEIEEPARSGKTLPLR